MGDLLTVVACFAGVFAYSFILAGLAALQDEEPPADWRAIAWLGDLAATGGIVSILRAVARNWNSRPGDRRLLVIGVACGVGCVACLWLAARCT